MKRDIVGSAASRAARRLTLLMSALATASLLAACGGGGPSAAVSTVPITPGPATLAPADKPPPALPSAQKVALLGMFGGTLTGTSTVDAIVILSEDDFGWVNVWGIYGTDAATDFKVAGMITSTDRRTQTATRLVLGAEDWGKVRWAEMDLSLDPPTRTITGSVSVPWTFSGALKLAAARPPAAGYQFVSPARMESIQGRWELRTIENRRLSIDIGADGTITGTSGTCSLYNSVIEPTSNGDGSFTFRMSFQSGHWACEEPHGRGDGVVGMAAVYLLPEGRGTQLVLGGVNGLDAAVYLAAAGRR